MSNNDNKPRINSGYPFQQLMKVLSGTGERMAARAKQWQQVLARLLDGTLRVGSRTPIASTPLWVTLNVVQGGFATGDFVAGGPLLPHELEKLALLVHSEQGNDRTPLNLYFLSDQGRIELSAMLASGSSPGFAEICQELAGGKIAESWCVVHNGMVIEQAQILTTHNLAVLFAAFDLKTTIHLIQLARHCFRWICQRQQIKINEWRAQLQMLKNTAYAWRQMLFYLSLCNPTEVADFMEWSNEHLQQQTTAFRQCFEPVIAGLQRIIAGESFGVDEIQIGRKNRRFLGWSVEKHWLLSASGEVKS